MICVGVEHSVVGCTLAFCLRIHTSPWEVHLKKKNYFRIVRGDLWEMGGGGAPFTKQSRASQRRRSHQCHYKHLPAWPTSNAVLFHQPQLTEGHWVNARNRWRLEGEKGGERAGGEDRGRGSGSFSMKKLNINHQYKTF